MMQALQSLLHFAQIGRARSSVINPLQWTLVLMIFGLFAVLLTHGPTWLLEFFVVLIGGLFLLLITAYVYFMIRNPDALRSETYSLAKSAIEKQMVGDSLSGLRQVVEILDGSDVRMLGAGSHDEEPKR
jgi:Mn2+/Fe2+ NRAMP family transporter